MGFIQKIKNEFAHYTWEIAYGDYNDDIVSNGLNRTRINIVKNPYKNKWFADPFILDNDSKYLQLLVEEFDSIVNKGRIARIRIDKRINEIVECSIILDLPTHLSFPAIYRIGDKVYVHPENSASGKSVIYQYDKTLDKLINPQVIVNEALTDAIITKRLDGYHLYATKMPNPNGCILYEYHSSKFEGVYKEIAKENYEHNSARMAGMFIDSSYGLIRPAQDCFGDYGKAVIMYQDHQKLCEISPKSYRCGGIHTFNLFGNTFVIDLKKYDYPLIYKLIRAIKK